METISIKREYIDALVNYCTLNDIGLVMLAISNYLETGERTEHECDTDAGNMIFDLICKDIDRQKTVQRKSFKNA